MRNTRVGILRSLGLLGGVPKQPITVLSLGQGLRVEDHASHDQTSRHDAQRWVQASPGTWCCWKPQLRVLLAAHAACSAEFTLSPRLGPY